MNANLNLLLQVEMNILKVQNDVLKDMMAEEERKKELEKNRRQPRECWTRLWVSRRDTLGEYKNIFRELAVEDPKSFRKYIRLDYTMFTEILDRIRPRITKQDTNWMKPLDPGLKLLCTLTYLSGGTNNRHRMFSSRLPHNCLSIVVREVCTAIQEEYQT